MRHAGVFFPPLVTSEGPGQLSFQGHKMVVGTIMKMLQINIFVFTLYVASSIGRPLNEQPSEFDSKADIQITKFHVDTSIQMR